MAGEDQLCVFHAEVPDDHFGENISEIGGHSEVSTLELLLRLQSGPSTIDLAPADVPSEQQHGVAVPVIGAAVAVLRDGPAKLRHRQHDDVVHPVTQVGGEGRDAPREVVEAGGQKPGAAAFVDVVIPVARLGERNLQTDVGLDQLGDLLECLAIRRERLGSSA